MKKRQYVFPEKGIFLTNIVFRGPIPLRPAHVICSLRKYHFESASPRSFPCAASAMIGMKMSQENISDILRLIPCCSHSFNKPFTAMKVNMAEKFLILLVAPACINKNDMPTGFDNKRSQGKDDQVVFVGWINPRP